MCPGSLNHSEEVVVRITNPVRMFGLAVVAAALTTVAASASAAAALDRDIHSYVVTKLDDFTATGDVVSVNERELNKISRDMVLLYKIHEVSVNYKEPNMVRIEGSQEGSHVTFIINGSKQIVRFNGATLRRDLGSSPGKRKSLMDMGLVSDYYLTYVDAKFLRDGSVDGTPTAVFDVTYKDRQDTSHHIIYIDPKTRCVLKRESYSQDAPGKPGHLQCTYYYKNLKEVATGVWFPTIIEVENTDRVMAGSTAYKDIHINVGLKDDRFKL